MASAVVRFWSRACKRIVSARRDIPANVGPTNRFLNGKNGDGGAHGSATFLSPSPAAAEQPFRWQRGGDGQKRIGIGASRAGCGGDRNVADPWLLLLFHQRGETGDLLGLRGAAFLAELLRLRFKLRHDDAPRVVRAGGEARACIG